MLYIGPWQCDCNLSLIGQITKCSAGDFRFDQVATEAARLTRAGGDGQAIARLDVTRGDWPTLRGNNARTAATTVEVVSQVQDRWLARAARQYTPTAPIAAGGLVYVAGSDGQVRALDGDNGEIRWQKATNFPIKQSP